MSKISGDDRRHNRRKLFYYLAVVDRDTGEEVGRLVDIHVAGMLLTGPRRFDAGRELNLRVVVEDELMEAMYGKLDVKVLVRWCKQDVNPDYYVTGVQFVGVTSTQERLIDELIRTMAFSK